MKSSDQYRIFEHENYILINLYGSLVSSSLSGFQVDIDKIVKGSFHIIFEMEAVREIAPNWIRALASIVKQMDALKKKVRFIGINSEIKELFLAIGMNSIFRSCANLNEALVDMGLRSNKIIDATFVNPFISATLKVLEVQTSTKGVPAKMFVKKSSELSGDISGVLGIESSMFQGSLVISFPQQTFLSVMSKMLGENIAVMNKEIIDGAGELINIIFSQAKLSLKELGYDMRATLPSVFLGKNLPANSPKPFITLVVPFESDSGKFFIEICAIKK